MKKRRHVRMFHPRFAPLVEKGEKTTTIRPTPKRPIRVGDVLDLRAWTGKPYRSKQRKLREAVCVEVTRIEIDHHRWFIWRTDSSGKQMLLNLVEAERLARRDGFADVDTLFGWFERTHGLPFKGVLIEWQP